MKPFTEKETQMYQELRRQLSLTHAQQERLEQRIMRSVRPTTAAMAIAPNATCERPSPIYENLFNTRITPRSDEHSAISTPTMSAYLTNGYEKYEINVLMMVMTSLQILRAGS